ncbi:mediator complex subunit [Malassezia cuniculi]|uniref:Mediator of RNA polymerase II transcription subunit 14 n=1 Tax=Malassezia cuniculi TaxID=948313 RepID=A0AAF0EWQ2_9BASI|nr:mediator complex subunit [Malassezia cuniculi]
MSESRSRDPGAPLAQLLTELPLEQTDLVPLGVLVERVSNTVYQTLQNLGDTLVSLTSDEKRRRIFETALSLRKLMLKLLVIVRWARDADQLALARNIIALLADQQWAHEDVFSGLTRVRSVLPNARLRDADLATAIDVARTRTYTRLPASIADSAIPRERMSDDEVKVALHGLDKALRVRLATVDTIPQGMRLEQIKDGKVYLAAPGLYKLTLAAASAKPTDRWWLLSFEFEHEAKVGDEPLPRLDAMYLEAVHAAAETALGDPEVLGRDACEKDDKAAAAGAQSTPADPGAPAPVSQTGAPTTEAAAPTCLQVPVASSTSSLVHLHAALEQHALQRQLDILHAQAQNMAVNWGSNVVATLDAQSRTLTVRYWARGGAPKKAPGLGPHLFSGALELRVREEQLAGRARVLAGIAGSTQSRSAIALTWDVDEAIGVSPPTLDSLDMEALVLAAIERHAHGVLRIMQEHIVPTGISTELRAQAAGRYGARHVLHLHHAALNVLLYVSTLGGRVSLKPLDGERGALAMDAMRTAELQKTADVLCANISSLPEVLTQLRLRAHSRQLATRAAWLGIASTSQIMLRAGELARLGEGHPLLFFPLPLGAHVLMLHLSPDGDVRFALLALVPCGDEGVAVGSCRWLDRAVIGAYTVVDGALTHSPDAIDSAEVSTSELSLMYAYCAATVAYSHIEEQLRLALVSFEMVGATTQTEAPPGFDDPLLPSLCVSADELLDGAGSRNVSIRIRDWWRPHEARVEVAFRLGLKGAPRNLPSARIHDATVSLDDGIFVFSTPNVTNAVAAFQRHWKAIVVLFALRDAVPRGSLNASVASYDLHSLQFVYGSHTATVSLRAHDCSFALELDGERNPHTLIAPLLEAELNAARDKPQQLWTGFMHYLHVSLPVLSALQSATGRALVDVKVPDVEARTVTWYRVRFARHAIDVRLLRHVRMLVTDASRTDEANGETKDGKAPVSAFERLPSLAEAWPSGAKGMDALDDHTLLVHGTDAAQHLPAMILRIAKMIAEK